MAGESILLTDDDHQLRETLQDFLAGQGYAVTAVADGHEARAALQEREFALALLDLMLPGIDGLEVCRQLKARTETAHIPIIMLTAKGEEADIVTGLEIGADDYVSKPFSMRLLLARMRAVLRRAGKSEAAEPRLTRVENLVIDDERHEALVDDRVLPLTLTEYKLLRFLARHPGRVFTRTQILSNIQDEQVLVVDRAIDVHVAALRRKLESAADLIETVRGVGYRFKG